MVKSKVVFELAEAVDNGQAFLFAYGVVFLGGGEFATMVCHGA